MNLNDLFTSLPSEVFSSKVVSQQNPLLIWLFAKVFQQVFPLSMQISMPCKPGLLFLFLFSFCTSLKDLLFQLVHSFWFFLELLLINLGYQPMARAAWLWPSIALFYIPGELAGVGRNNSSCISRTEFQDLLILPSGRGPTPAVRGDAHT